MRNDGALLFMCSWLKTTALLVLVVASLPSSVQAGQQQQPDGPLGESGAPVDLEYQKRLIRMQEEIAATDNNNNNNNQEEEDENYWEYVVLRINGLDGPLATADTLSCADVKIDVRALTSYEPNVEFWNNELMSQYTWKPQTNNDNPTFGPELGVVAYRRGTASELSVQVTDVELIGNDEILLNATANLDWPSQYDEWVVYTLVSHPYTLHLSTYRSVTPLYSSREQIAMDLTEKFFYNNDGSVASLVYKTSPNNKRAVLYIPGRADSFAHPHVLKMYESLGYDFYSLDARYCGRTRRFMVDTQYGHWIDDFDKYREEMDATIEFIRSQNKSYDSVLSHSFSTGSLIALNYVMQLEREQYHHPRWKSDGESPPPPFDGYILSSPFLDWDQPFFEELVVENTEGLVESIMENQLEARGLSVFHTRLWTLFRWNVTLRPLIQTHANSKWAQAVTSVQRKIKYRPIHYPILGSEIPVLLIGSRGDQTLDYKEAEKRMPRVAATYSISRLENNQHDIVMSYVEQLNDDALHEIRGWLTTNIIARDDAEDVVTTTSSRGGILNWFYNLFGR